MEKRIFCLENWRRQRLAFTSLPKKGENAIVFGAGTIGIAAAIALKYFGAEKEMVCTKCSDTL